MIDLFLNFFMKSYVVGTHYNHLVDKIQICYHINSFFGEISKEFSESFYWMPFLLGDRFIKDSLDIAGKKKQTDHINYCEEKSWGILRNF